MIESYELPLFPLHTVLFPGQMLPWRIFEPRYEQMMDDENRALQILLAAAHRRGEMDGAFSQN